MADVTGNIGNESVRLRGMALEDTQYRMQQDIEDLVDIATKMAAKQNINLNNLNSSTNKLGQALSGAATAAGAAGAQSGKLGSLLNKLNAGGQKFKAVMDVVGGLNRILRNMDSNIGDASYTMRSLGASIRGPMGKFIEYTANSVSQLEDQFQVYKRLNDMGGAVANDFDNLRVNAARTGVTLQEYAGLVAENYTNLRLGGRSVRNTISELTKSVESLVDDDKIPYIMKRLGIDAGDFGKVILQQTGLMGGFSKVYKEQGSNFGNTIVNAVKSTKLLSEAFGAQSSQVMNAMKAAADDALFAQMFENMLPEQGKVKDAVFKSVASMGLSDEEAKQLTVSILEGIPTPIYQQLMTAGGEPFIEAVRNLANDVAKADPTKNLDDQVRPSLDAVGATLKEFRNTFGKDIGFLFAPGADSGLRRGFEVMTRLSRQFSTEGIKPMLDSINDENLANKGNIDTLYDVQKQNIKLAITAAKANVALNSFGLTAANGVQLLAHALVGTTGTVLGEAGNVQEIKDLQNLMRDYTKKGNNIVEELQKELADLIRTQVKLTEQQSGTRTNTGNNTPAARSATADASTLSTVIGVKTTTAGKIEQIPISDLDKRGGQATAGGPTPVSTQQLLASIHRRIGAFNLTAVDDPMHRELYPGSVHTKGHAIDISIPNGSKQDYAAKTAKIVEMLTNFGLTGGSKPGEGDYYIRDEANRPIPGRTTGPHIHLELLNPNKFSEQFQQGINSLTAPPRAAPNDQSGAVNSQSSTVSSDSPSVNTAVAASPSGVNSSAAVADTLLTTMFSEMVSEIRTMRIAVQNLETTMDQATA